jgi:phenylpropionate dioxygenase-like ring-hydroxylating dioxygenase large terminal subunit
MYLRNTWYVAASWDELEDGPVGRMILGEPVVVFRAGNGRLAALEDRCIHRRAPLSPGKVVGDAVQCPYHGFQFVADGSCIRIPGQTQIPRAARVKSYPVVERHRYAWLWMGNPAFADESLIPDFSTNDRPGWAATGMTMPVRAEYLLLVENLLDLSHVLFVHSATIGSDDTSANLSLERGRNFVRSVRRSVDIPTPPHNVKQGLAERCDQTKTMTFYPGSFVTLEIVTTERVPNPVTLRILLHNALTPETETSCHYFWSTTRDFQVDDAGVTKFLRKVTAQAFEEDLSILELQQRSIDLAPSAPTVSTSNDAAAVAARRLMDELMAAEAGALAAE